MDILKRQRKAFRIALTRTVNEVDEELAKEGPDFGFLRDKLLKLEDVLPKVSVLDEQISLALLEANCTDAQHEEETLAAEEYEDKVRTAKRKINDLVYALPRTPSPAPSEFSTAVSGAGNKKTYKLPKIQLKKFSGELTEWLGWWAQFKKIDGDEELHDSDKFQYLVQCMVAGTRARDLVDRYPQSEENYPKVIAALKERFGDPKLLNQVYVRELIKMIINRHREGREKASLSTLYDKLESHLRSLDTLGVTVEQMERFLFPMVESSVPEDILIAWQRSPLCGKDGTQEDPPKSELDYFMQFLKQEVRCEEQRILAKEGFGLSCGEKKKHISDKKKVHTEDDVPTAAGLFSGHNQKGACIFCDKSHESKDCITAQSMSLKEKTAVVQNKKCCFQCLRHGHQSKSCKTFVKCILCEKRHLVLMCPGLENRKKNPEANKPVNEQVHTVNANLASSSPVFLKTLLLEVIGKKETRKVRAIMDDGSQGSYIKKSVAETLGLKVVSQEQVIHTLFSGVRTEPQKHSKYQVKVRNPNGTGSTKFLMLDQDKICGGIPRLPMGPWMAELNRKKIWVSDTGTLNQEIEILLGADVIGGLLIGEVIQLKSGLTAVETRLGWTVMGKLNGNHYTEGDNMSQLVTNMTVSASSVDQLWSLEVLGIRDPAEAKSITERNEDAKCHFEETVTRGEDGRYRVSLPWVNGPQRIQNNKIIAEKRLMTTSTKLEKLKMLEEYGAIFKAWEKEGIVEAVHESLSETGHYLPHRAVLKPESLTTPIRPVFDASCKTQRSPSLNDCLEKGPNLLELIPSILLRFRENRIGVISDIRKAFQMIEVKKEDRDFLRFIWWEDFEKRKFKIYRHCRVVFGANCSPFLLAAVIEHHLEAVQGKDREVALKLLKSLYVDNCVTSVNTVQECQEFQETTTRIMAEAKMELRQWEFGSTEVSGIGQHSWCGLDQTNSNSNLLTSVLGLKWDKAKDTLFCDIPMEEECIEKLTKRKILSQVQKVFDPMGYLCPALLQPKLILQETWAQKTGWDEELSEDIKSRYAIWSMELHSLKKVQIPRYFGGGDSSSSYTLHTFCDASKLAYAAAVFLRVELEGEVSVHLLQGKARVAPLKTTTIPRLELLGCTIAARLTATVKNSLSMKNVQTQFWTDSSTVLAWIRRNNDWGTFVGNRVKEICELTEVEDWRHVPGDMNPADLPSRGCSPEKLVDCKWWEGPHWLKRPQNEWPNSDGVADEEEISKELKKGSTILLLADEKTIHWYARKSSKFSENVRIFAWIKRFVNRATKKMSDWGELSHDELYNAELHLMKVVQREVFPTHGDVISGLRIQHDEQGIIRVKTKLVHRQEDSEIFRLPVLLPNSHTMVEQLIREEHLDNGHAGAQFLMSKIRERYWIIQGRKAIRRLISSCGRCRRYAAKAPKVCPAPLPADRVKTARAFEISGVDLAGPLFLKDGTRAYIVLFTCAIYRCVHLELVTALTTEAFLLALIRFIKRKRRPTTIYSDNGTNFVGAVNLFNDLNWKEIERRTKSQRIKWVFNPPAAPWWGGWWERLIRSVKDQLKRMLGNRKLSYAQLETCLSEVECTINHRPLTFVTEDSEDLIPLTPAMFIHDLPESECPEEELADVLNGKYKNLKQLSEELRSRFRKEYLAQLVQRGKSEKLREFRIGDVVLVGMDNKKRLEWPMARIIQLMPGKDGMVRVAKVKTAIGELIRPIQRLYPLEVSHPEESPPITEGVKRIAKKQSEDNPEIMSELVPEVRTSSGRLVKVPIKFSD